MKDKFKEFYRYSDSEIKNIWDNCIFVFDTNVLLDLYRYSKDTSDKYISILMRIKAEKRIWIPHQVGLEFHRERIILISDLKNSYSEIKKVLENSIHDAQKKIDDKYHKEHPFLNLNGINTELDECLKKIVETIDKNEKDHPDWFNNDSILSELNKILKNNVGEEYSKERLEEIYKEGKIRYASNTPPGYEDAADKEDDKKYGDLVIWFQMIDKAKELKKPIIFVTRDKKEDWWWRQSGNTIGPRYQLKKEISTKAQVDFHMYDSERFLEYAFSHYKLTVDKKALKEVKRVKALEERNYRTHKTLINDEFKSPFLRDFVRNQESLMDELLILSRQMELDEDVIYEFKRNQERAIRFVNRFSREGIPHPMMLEDFFMLQERMQGRIIDLLESKRLSREQSRLLIHFLDRISDSSMDLLRFMDNEGLYDKYYHRMMNNRERLQRNLREYM